MLMKVFRKVEVTSAMVIRLSWQNAKNEYTSSFYDVSKSYGTKIINTYTKEVNIKNRGVIERNDLTGFNWSKVPVVLVKWDIYLIKKMIILLVIQKIILK